MTIDGVCDHSVGIVDEELHHHYSELISKADIIIYGRKTYELMHFWKTLVEIPSENQSMNDFAASINKISKLVFSTTLRESNWKSAELSNMPLQDKILELKHQTGKNILVGSRSLIIQLLNKNLIDEFQLCVHPLVEGKGLSLFDQIESRITFKLEKTKSLKSGVIVLYYKPISEN